MKPLSIEIPRLGIAPSPHIGVADCRNLDIYTNPGVVSLNNLTAKKSSTTVVTLPKWIVKNPATPAEVYALDSGGKVYKSTDSGVNWVLMTGFTAGGAGQGLAIWKNYLFVAHATKIDVCGDGTATGITNANWTQDWTTAALASDVLYHPMLVSKNDGKLYIGAGRYVVSLDEVSGQTFAPGTSATYTLTEQALDLPPNYRIKCLAELGNNLMCGTWQGTNIYDLKIADIFPWDRSSSSFGQPVQMDEFGVHSMLVKNNILYVAAGIEGRIYKSDGVSAIPIVQIPESIASLAGGKYLEFYPGALVSHKGRIMFGIGGSAAIDGMGVYSLLETSKGTILTMEHTISTGNTGASVVCKISALLPITRDNILIGWRDDTSYGIDNITTSSYKTSYSGYYDSPLYQISDNNKEAPTTIELYFARPLRTNEGVRLQYRDDLTASFATIDDFDYTTYGAVQSISIPNTENKYIPKSEFLQIRVLLTGTTTTPTLRAVILS